MHITTLPVYSRYADDGAVPPDIARRQPAGLHLAQHQLDTYLALTSGEYDVVINTAMTGDGKSLAAQLQTLATDRSVIMMYPTNELVRDQQGQVAQALHQWQRAGEIRATTMTGDSLREIVASGLYSRKADAIRSLAANHDILLTNPDIFHYIAQFLYTRRSDSPDALFGRLLDLFDLFVFDEFHIFEAPQVVAVLNALLLIRAAAGPAQPKRFLFLSATPGGLLAEYLQRAGFRVKLVTPTAEGLYQHTPDQPDAARWRPILRGSDIHFWPVRAEEWVEAHLEDTLLAFFRAHGRGAKGAFIVNSVAVAHRLVERLQPRFAHEGLTVRPNTGLTGPSLRQASREADLLIGTSTVDVGVDFRINFLVFESRDAGTFLQRLGRLGRHADDGRGQRFGHFAAHTLIPPFVEERLFVGRQNDLPLLQGAGQCSREQLTEAIRRAYPSPFEFRSYAQEWGWVQSAHVYMQLFNKTVSDSYAGVRENLKADLWKTFRFNVGAGMMQYRDLKAQLPLVVEEAQSFRGGSPFNCGILDDTPPGDAPGPAAPGGEQDRRDRIKQYDLLMLAANAELDWLGAEEFTRRARACGAQLTDSEIAALLGWFRLRKIGAERKEVQIMLNQNVGAWGADRWGTVQCVRGITLDVPSAGDWLSALNRELRTRSLVALLCLCEPRELLKRLYLPPMFEIYPFAARDLTGSIAFAREALMLHVAIKERGFPCGGGAIIC